MKSNLILISILLFCTIAHSMKRDSENHSNKRVIKKQKIYHYAQEEMHEYTAIGNIITEPNNNDQQNLSIFDRLPTELVLIIFEVCILDSIDQIFDNSDFETLANETDLISENGINKLEFLKNAIYTCNQNIQNIIIGFANRDIDFNGYFHQSFKKNAAQYFKTQFVKKLKANISNTDIYRLLQGIAHHWRNNQFVRKQIPENIQEAYKVPVSPLLNQQIISTDTATDNVHMFIVEALLLARNNENRPEGQDIQVLKCLLNGAMKHKVLPIIYLLMEKETLENQHHDNTFLDSQNVNYLIENENIITIFLTHNHLRQQIIFNLSMRFCKQYLNYAKESFDRTETINYLTASKIIPILLDFCPINTKFDNGAGNLLMAALYLNDKATVKKLLDSDINFNYSNSYRQTALHFVQSLDNESEAIAVAKDIIEKGKFNCSDLHRFDKFGLTPIHYAYLKYYMKLATFLLNIECSSIPNLPFMNRYSVHCLAILAAKNNSLKLLKDILEKYSVKVNVLSPDGRTLLMLAAKNNTNDIELIILLLNKGANITFMDKSYRSTLSYLSEFITSKIKNLIQNPNNHEKLLRLKEILWKRLDEAKSTDSISPKERITDFQEFLEKNIN